MEQREIRNFVALNTRIPLRFIRATNANIVNLKN